jgi:hypothetical protein
MIIKDNTLEIYRTDCIYCKHYTGAYQCKAFAQGIPDRIIEGKIKHITPYTGDNGIQFVEKKFDK